MKKTFLLLAALLSCIGSCFAQQVLPISAAGVVQAPVDQNGWKNFKVTLTQTVTAFQFTGVPTPSQAQVSVIFTENATGGFGVTFSSYTAPNGQVIRISNACSVTTAASATTLCQFTYDSTTNTWIGVSLSSFSNAVTFSAAGAASTPGISVTGTPFTGGSGTTTVPLVYLNDGPGPSLWSTNGTYFGINGPSGFVGNYVDFHTNGGTSDFSIAQGGSVIARSVIQAALFKYPSGNQLFTSAAPTISSGFSSGGASIANNNGPTSFTVNVGTGTMQSTGVVGLPAAANGWNCQANDLSTPSGLRQTGSTPTTATFTNYVLTTGAAGNFTASDILGIMCIAY